MIRQSPTDISTEKKIKLLKKYIDLIGLIPPSNFKDDPSYLKGLNKDDFDEAVKIFHDMPKYHDYKMDFGSWFKALIETGVLKEGTRKTSRGYMCRK